jgi:sugar lactone lactonase YvrE
VTRVDDGYRITNGPAFSPDGRIMYHTDTLRRTVYAFDVDDGGIATNKRVFLSFGDETRGNPDGMNVDAEGGLWIAFWDGWCVRRYAPDGHLTAERTIPAAQVTSVVFAGAGLDRMFVTSAAVDLDKMGEHALAGGLFEVEAPGVTGLPMPMFEG